MVVWFVRVSYWYKVRMAHPKYPRYHQVKVIVILFSPDVFVETSHGTIGIKTHGSIITSMKENGSIS